MKKILQWVSEFYLHIIMEIDQAMIHKSTLTYKNVHECTQVKLGLKSATVSFSRLIWNFQIGKLVDCYFGYTKRIS